MSRRSLYKHQFYNLDWTEKTYESRNIKSRASYRKGAKERRQRDNLETALYPQIDEAQKIITLKYERYNNKRKSRQGSQFEAVKTTEFDFEGISEQERFFEEPID